MTIASQAAVLSAPGQPLENRGAQLTEPQPGEALVRTAAGICGTDVYFNFAVGAFSYRIPTVPGHEASGTVAAVGAGITTVAPGDRDIVCDETFCGQCAACLSGAMVYCTAPSAKQRQRMRLGDEPIRQYLGVSAFAELIGRRRQTRARPHARQRARPVTRPALTTRQTAAPEPVASAHQHQR